MVSPKGTQNTGLKKNKECPHCNKSLDKGIMIQLKDMPKCGVNKNEKERKHYWNPEKDGNGVNCWKCGLVIRWGYKKLR